MKYYLPIHLDGGNRGCEAITKGTAQILKVDKNDIVVLSRDIELDDFLGVDNFTTIVPSKKDTLLFKCLRKIRNTVVRDEYKKLEFSYKSHYKDFIKSIPEDGVMLSTGGDMMCYGENEVIYTNEVLHQKGIKTILWGCSIGKKNLTSRKIETLKHFSLIYARESLTKETLESIGVGNVVVFPDPAFILAPEVVNLPRIFNHGKVIGINLSNYVVGGFDLNTHFGKELIKFLDYVIENTDLQVLLVPHVLWEGQDDRIISDIVYNNFKCTNRISVLESEKYNYCQIRYIISHCSYFIGARTHSMISAYSTCVPSIALGYSIKSIGIAKDLKLPDWSVIDCSCMKSNSLVDSFIKLIKESDAFRFHMLNTIPDYVNRLQGINDYIR